MGRLFRRTVAFRALGYGCSVLRSGGCMGLILRYRAMWFFCTVGGAGSGWLWEL